jgi:periplasmic copper chaperone A
MSKRPAARCAALAVLALVLALLVTACGGSALPDPASGSLEFSNAWVRAAGAGGMTAAYFDVTNGRSADDALTGVASPAASAAGLHETTTDGSGMMGMQEVASVNVPAGGTVSFAPGGYHVMLMGLEQDLVAGSRIDLTFATNDSGSITVSAEVRDN